MRCKHLISFLLLLVSAVGFSQNFSNKGKEFWVGYGHHQYMEPSCDGSSEAPNDMNMVLYLSAEEAAIVTVTIDSSGTSFVPAWSKTYTIPAYTVISTENLPKGPVASGAPSNTNPNYDARLFDNAPPLGSGGENLWRKKGIHITSNVPIVAYAHIYGGVSSGATMLMPVNTWGYSYTSVNSEQGGSVSSCYSWMYVIAKENNTLVQIIPSATSRRGKPAGVPFNVLIQKGQIYQLVGNADCQTGSGPELTGTTVKSLVGPDGKCHPVAVFGGSSRTGGETFTCGGGSGRDNDMQQLFPEHAWGKRYATTPFSKSQLSTLQPSQFQTSVYKVVVKDPATIVKRNGVQLTGIIGGKYYKFSSNTADYILADKPVMVAQFMSGTSACNGGDGDPEMIILSPIEQAIKQVGFYRNTKENINANYLTLTVPTPGLSSLRIDNSATFSYTYPHPNLPGYTVVVKGWIASQSQALVRCDSGFTAITYGLGGAESYGYNAGTYINNLSAIGAIHNTFDTTNTSNSFTCTRTPVELSVLMAYRPLQMQWLLNTLSTVITPSANVLVNAPVVVDSPLVNGVKYYKYTLPGSYSFSDTGTFTIPIVVTSPAVDNCTQMDSVSYTITVKGKPVADFTYTHSGCYTDTIYFAGNGSAGNYTINRWRWVFPVADPDSIRYPKRVLPVGTHNIKLQVISQEGCVGDTSRQIVIAAPPSTNFTITPGTLCEPSAYSFASATAAGTGVSFYWDFGNGNTTTGTTNTASATYPNYGTYTIKHVATQTGQCPSDTVRKTVTIFAKPRVSFGYPVGCLALDGTAQFNDSTITPDSQTLTYAWDFGDAANATVANPNTSTLKNPSHKYIAFGTYNVKLSVTTANGCTKDTIIACTFAVRPVLAYAPLVSVCANSSVVSVAGGSSVNGVPGTGIYKGQGTDTAGNFNPSVAGPGIKTIWYVFTSTGGCVDSISQTIKVFPKPTAAFALSDTSFCLNVSTTITPNSTIAGGTIKDWKWDFGSGTVTYANNNPFVQNFATPGPHIIRLYNISDSSCVSDTVSKAVNVNALPVASFTFTHTGCKLDTIYLSGAGSAPGYTVSNWKWNFANGDTSVLQNPKIILPTGIQIIKLRATSTEGCFDDTTQTITVFAPPVAGLTSSPLSTCEPGTVNFTDASTYGGTGAIVGSYWDFGNGQTLNNTNNNAVANLYPVYGTYPVKHVVKVSDLCISDTATQTIKVFAKPRVDFTYPIGCLPLSNIAQFTNATTVPDGQTLSYTWNFGDANATSGNPNISTATNPTHQYNAYGQYNINLSVTSANGCVKDTTIQVTFNVRPTLAFAPLTGVCVNAVPVSVARGSVTNGVPGTGVYAGPGTDAAGLFNPALAGTGVKTIWYIFTSTAGCKDSLSQTIRVHPKPTANFTLSIAAFCANAATIITPQATIATGSVTTYTWDFGDNTNAVYANNSPFTKSYASGNYNVKLYAISDSSCVSDTVSKPIIVAPVPKAAFDLPVSICMPAGKAQFSNRSTITGGTLTYNWNFGDLGTSTDKDPLHIYSATGPYTVTLRATSAAGCFSDTSRQLTTFYDQPVALFDVNPDVLCQGKTNIFTDRSTAPNSSISNWSWQFGDGSRSSIRNPAKKFNVPGNYTVSLNVESLQGCQSDTFKKTVFVYLQPLVNAGPSFTVLQNTPVRFAALASDTTVSFLWTPGFDLSSDTILTPSLVARTTQVYFLTATGAGNCTASDSLIVKVLRPFTIPNAFSPNGDGINDTWAIAQLSDYPGATIEIYDRYGHRLLQQTGYYKPWDGKYEQKPLPIGTYYYIINPGYGLPTLTGSVTIIR